MSGGQKTIEMLRNVAKKTKSPVAKELAKDSDFEDALSVACQLFHETMEEVREGEMKWKEAVEDLHKNLMALEMPEAPESEEK